MGNAEYMGFSTLVSSLKRNVLDLHNLPQDDSSDEEIIPTDILSNISLNENQNALLEMSQLQNPSVVIENINDDIDVNDLLDDSQEEVQPVNANNSGNIVSLLDIQVSGNAIDNGEEDAASDVTAPWSSDEEVNRPRES